MTFSNKALVDSPASSPIPTSPQHSLFSYLYKMTQVANIHNAKSRAFPQNFFGFLGMSHLRINPCPKCQFSVYTSRSISFVISASLELLSGPHLFLLFSLSSLLAFFLL